MIDMKGKVAVVLGVANKRSIAYAIAEKLAAAGATLVLCYQSERLQEAESEAPHRIPRPDRRRPAPSSSTSPPTSRSTPPSPRSPPPSRSSTPSSTPSPSRPPTPSRTTSCSPSAPTSRSPTTSASTPSSPSPAPPLRSCPKAASHAHAHLLRLRDKSFPTTT